MPQQITRDQIRAAVEICLAVAEAIRELGSVPSGHLYASLADKLSLTDYNSVIEKLIDAKLIRREPSHLLVWQGPPR